MEYLICVIAGIVMGGYAVYFTNRKDKEIKPSGTFVIDLSDPMKDICRLDLSEDLDSIYFKQQIVLNIKTIGEFTQE